MLAGGVSELHQTQTVNLQPTRVRLSASSRTEKASIF